VNRRTCGKRRPNLTCERFAESRNITPQLMSAAGRRGHSSPSQPRAAVGLHPCSGEYSGFFWSARGLRGNRGCIPRFSLFAPPPPVVLLTVGVCAFCSVRRALLCVAHEAQQHEVCVLATKIFAKIEWKDTSKNPTGSKNNSLSE